MSGAFAVVPGAYAGGLRYVDVVSEAVSGRLFLHGAQVTSWRPAGVDDSLIWLSEEAVFREGTAIRGGIPICFPWFGPDKPPAGGPSHGLARLVNWRMLEATGLDDGAVSVSVGIDSSEPAPDPGWAHAFRVRDGESGAVGFSARLTAVFGASLDTRLEVTNTGARAIGFEAALHSYYRVADVTRVHISGLEGAPFVERASGATQESRVEQEPIRFAGEVDRIYEDAPSRVTLVDEVTGGSLLLESVGAGSWVVWNPHITKAAAMADFGDDEWRTMVCVEPAALHGGTVWLEPGECHTLVVAVRRS